MSLVMNLPKTKTGAVEITDTKANYGEPLRIYAHEGAVVIKLAPGPLGKTRIVECDPRSLSSIVVEGTGAIIGRGRAVQFLSRRRVYSWLVEALGGRPRTNWIKLADVALATS